MNCTGWVTCKIIKHNIRLFCFVNITNCTKIESCMNCIQKCTAKCLLECNQNTVHSAIFLPVCVLIATLSLQVRPNPNSILYPFPLSLETECQGVGGETIPLLCTNTILPHVIIHHLAPTIYTYWCALENSILMRCLLTHTHTHRRSCTSHIQQQRNLSTLPHDFY